MLTEETALRIVKQAEEQHNPKEVSGLSTLVGCVTGCFLGENDQDEDGTLAWLEHSMDGNMECVVSNSSEEVAERLAKKVNYVVELLSLAHDQEKKLHDVIVAYRALKADIKKHTK
jgi:hypothetical protein